MLKKIYFSLFIFIFLISSYFYFKDMIPFDGIKSFYVDKIIIVLSAVIVTYGITALADFVFLKIFGKFIRSDSLARKIMPLLHNVSTVIIWVIGILFTLSLLGFNISAFLTGAGIGGIVLALAGKEAASNLIGSLSLIFSKNFKIGDKVRIKGFEGNVSEITLSYTKIIDKDGNFVFIPNKNVIAEPMEVLMNKKKK